MKPIAVTGLGTLTPFGLSPQALLEGARTEARAAHWPHESLRRLPEPIPAVECRRDFSALPRATQLAVSVAHQALSDAKVRVGSKTDPERIGLYVATCCGLLDELNAFEEALRHQRSAAAGPYAYQELTLGALAGHVCIAHQIRGPSYPLIGDPTGAAPCMDLAASDLNANTIDVALVVNVEPAGPAMQAMVEHAQATSRAAGTSPGWGSEVAVALVLERATLEPQSHTAAVSEALRAPYGILRTADRHDAARRAPALMTPTAHLLRPLGWTGTCSTTLDVALSALLLRFGWSALPQPLEADRAASISPLPPGRMSMFLEAHQP